MPKSKAIQVVEKAPSNGSTLIPEQGLRLMNAMNGEIDKWAIKQRKGPNGMVLNYIPHGYVRDQLNQVFGPFWSERPVPISPGRMYDIIEYTVERYNERLKVKELKPVREVIVMTELRIRIYSTEGIVISEESHFGSGGKIWENNISFADTLQSAQSEGLKRAAFSLGRKFGLQLYYDSEELRGEWQKQFAPKDPPKNIAQFMGRIIEENITDEEFFTICRTDYPHIKEYSDVREKDIEGLWRLVEVLLTIRSEDNA